MNKSQLISVDFLYLKLINAYERIRSRMKN